MDRQVISFCAFLLAVVTATAFIAVLIFDSGKRESDAEWQDELTRRGVCEWYADPKTGVRELKWKCGEVE